MAEYEMSREKIEARIAFAAAFLPKKAAAAAFCYINAVGHIALDGSMIPGVIDNPKLIQLSDMPVTNEQKEAHKKLLDYVAKKFEMTPEDLYNAKQMILEACDPVLPETT